LLALVAGGAWTSYQLLLKPKAGTTAQTAGLRTAKVTSGAIRRVLRLTGATSAKNFAMIAAPRMQGPDFGRELTLIYVAKSGGMVKKGELIAQIDPQSRMMDHIDDVDTQIQQADADVRKRRAEQALTWEALQQNIRVTQAELEKSKLDSSASEVRTAIDIELLKLSVEEQQATLKQQQADLPIQKLAHAAEIRILELTRERHKRHYERDMHNIEKCKIKAPMSGLVVMQTIWRGTEMGQVQQGDQISPAQPFMQIVDTSGMQVQSTASQVESDEMRLGQAALVTFDAFPDLKLKAKVSAIGAIATGGRNVNYFMRTVPVYLSILDHDNRVIPDLSTAANVVVNQSESSLLIPREAVESRDGKWFVRLKAGDRFVPREVQLGVSDNLHVAVLDGVREGDEIAIERPAVTLVASN
jgi:multidrug efflux pump subunit AcrA (membrane-fusion protein)